MAVDPIAAGAPSADGSRPGDAASGRGSDRFEARPATAHAPQTGRPIAGWWTRVGAVPPTMPALSLVTILALWWAASASGAVPAFLLPAPATVAATFAEMVLDGDLLRHTAISTFRLVVGYVLSVAAALPLAFLLSQVEAVRRPLEPLLEFLRQVPPLAMMPLLILWLGIGEAQKIGIIVLACFFPVFLATLGGIAQCDPRLVEVGRVSGFTRTEILRRIVLPAALPAVVVGLRIALGQGWRALVGAELVASAAGLGYMIVDAENLARTDIVVVGILVIGTLGLASDHAARRLVVRIAPWADPEEATRDARL